MCFSIIGGLKEASSIITSNNLEKEIINKFKELGVNIITPLNKEGELMVITVTLNPTMAKTLTVDNYILGKVNRATSIRYDIGGKGINISKVLVNLEIESTCTGFLGGIWGKTFKGELVKR